MRQKVSRISKSIYAFRNKSALEGVLWSGGGGSLFPYRDSSELTGLAHTTCVSGGPKGIIGITSKPFEKLVKSDKAPIQEVHNLGKNE